jgi:hypothetical protein
MEKTLKTKRKRQEPKVDQPDKDLIAFIAEADFVEQMTATQGWEIIKRDLSNLRVQRLSEIPYFDKETIKFRNAVIEVRAIDKLFYLIDDYSFNKKQIIDELNKLNNPKDNVVLDVDN